MHLGATSANVGQPFSLRVVQPITPPEPIAPLASTLLVNNPDPLAYSMTDGVVLPEKNIPLDVVIKLAHQDPIWANRGKAIQSYAVLEQSLCALFEVLGGMTHEAAHAIFYKITSSDSRDKILERLLHQKHGRTFNLFWNAYFKELRKINLKRNEIVHWLSAVSASISDTNMIMVGVVLVHPASLANKSPQSYLTSNDLLDFAIKCDVFARACNMFVGVTSHRQGEDAERPWLDIFQQPLVYPLPEDHPLRAQKPSKPDIPPRSSQA